MTIPGDFIDLQQMFLREADPNIQALTKLEVATIAIDDLRAAAARPAIGRALWIDVLVEPPSPARHWSISAAAMARHGAPI